MAGEITLYTPVLSEQATGGGLEGASQLNREFALWRPAMGSPDKIINSGKPLADARARDMVLNDGYANGAVSLHRDGVVGTQFMLNVRPKWKVVESITGVKVPDEFQEEFAQIVEGRFGLIAESENNWLDASRMNTLTGLVRLAVGGFIFTGEVAASVEWIREADRPLRTAFQLVSPDRLCNPDGLPDGPVPGRANRFYKRGVEKDERGKPVRYWVKKHHPGDLWNADSFSWIPIDAQLPWGRKQFIHIIEQLMPDQSRGVADMVAALKTMRMTKRFSEVTLQNAVINASYAAAIESELPSNDVIAAMGGGQQGFHNAIGWYLDALAEYLGAANNVAVDGAKIPHFFPGTKLNLKPMGTPGGVGTGFEESLHRHTAANLGLSYEEYSRDFSKVSYAGARASMAVSGRAMAARKKFVADRTASNVYYCVFEEEWNAGNYPVPPGMKSDDLYKPLMREALMACTWTGSGTSQIDELKETQAAILRIKSGLSTYEKECAKLGNDFREIFEQRAREEGIIGKLGLAFSLEAQREGSRQRQNTLSDDPKTPGQEKDDKDAAEAA